ncbi:unnamed protein product [Rotaria sordida]|uniref:LTD domain-containing protein n=1 Tax=Rotaria sordida TaxID=392033 RepID=A0A819D4J4_9BILA|nr:unnamed protein product [Rotaria sordida]CAF3828574.1 unnamed protein product [Rotaria sordida]
MALIQRYTTELSTRAGTSRQIHDDVQSVGQILNDVAAIKQQDEDEKHYLHSLNNRLEELLNDLNDLEIANKKLRDDLNLLITNWGIGGENRVRFLQELDEIIRRLGEQNRHKITFHAEAKIFDEQTQLIDRVTAVFIDVLNLYRDKSQILFDLTNELEEELRKIRLRLDISNAQVKSHDDDYRKELEKFRSYLSEWSQLALDKQNLLNEIQTLREHYNLRLAYNQEEINEWQRLLNRISQESKNYYRDYLDTIKQKIQIDYEQMAKEQQMEVEIQLKSRLKEIQEKIDMGLPIDENDERRRREETQRFESRLDESTKEHDRLHNDYRILAEEVQHKRRILQDFENELRNKARKHAEQHSRLEHDADLTRTEYYTLKDELDKLAYTLRFSVEEELKIYEALLNSLHRKKEERPAIDDSKYRQAITTTTTSKRFFDTMSSGGESAGFPRSQSDISDITRKFTTQTNIDDSTKYRLPPSVLTDTTTTTTKTIKQQSDNTIPVIRIDEAEKPSSNWTYETVSSGTTPSIRSESTDRDRSTERTIIPARTDAERYDIQQNLLDQNRTTTTTTRTTRRFGHSSAGQQSTGININRREQEVTSTIPEVDEKFLQSRVHITRKYKGNILIKFVDVSGRFVEIENTGNQPRDLTGWYIERTVDGRRIDYTFPVYELGPQTTVRIYGNYHRRSPSIGDDHHLQLIAPNFYDWGNGREMRTELFNPEDIGKAIFEQTIKD